MKTSCTEDKSFYLPFVERLKNNMSKHLLEYFYVFNFNRILSLNIERHYFYMERITT